MAVSRRKAPKQEAPQTIEAATASLSEYRSLIDTIDALKADANTSIAQIESARDGFIAPLDQRVKEIFRQLRAWWGVAAPALTEPAPGKRPRKSIELAGCIIGERTTTPALKHPGLKSEEMVDALEELLNGDVDDLLRVTITLDKQACLRAIARGDDLGALLRWLGAEASQKEEFFIDRAGKKDADPELVDVAEAPNVGAAA